MRLISQDGYLDAPYELSALRVGAFCGKALIYVMSNLLNEKHSVFAEYSSEKKALEAMKRLRKAHSKIPNYSYNDEYFEDLVFQFPKDNEV